MKSIIIYESTHHENTKKLVDALAKKHNMKTVSIENAESVDLLEYDIMGLAAGIAFGGVCCKNSVRKTGVPSLYLRKSKRWVCKEHYKDA